MKTIDLLEVATGEEVERIQEGLERDAPAGPVFPESFAANGNATSMIHKITVGS